MNDLTGQTVAGYPIEKALGKGSYSITYQATTSASPLAVKLLRDDLRADGALNKAISYGWESTRQITHANLVVMFSAGIDPTYGAYCLEEVVKGKSLREFILQGAKVAWRDCLILVEQLIGAIQALHAAGKCHGDIWPSNILITQDQDLKLEGAGGLTLLDRMPTEVAQGPAAGYMAPEHLQGSPVSQACDIYAAGACIYFIMAGRDAFPGDKTEAIARQVLERNPQPLSAWRDDSPPEADEFIGRLMAKDPTQRYGSIDDVIADVALLKSNKPLAPLKGGKPAAPPKFKPRVQLPSSQQRLTPRSGGVVAPASRPSGGLSGLRASASGASASGVQKKSTSGFSPAARSGTSIKVFGHLDTQVKSTIPQSEVEKKGDDYYRQGQLPLALSCWKDAFENATPHTALKVKIELGERDLKKESYAMAMDEARAKLTIGDYKGAIARSREAMLSADSEQQRQEAIRIEEQAGLGFQSAAKASTIKMVVGIVLFIIGVFVLFALFGGKPVTDDHEELPPEDTPKVPVAKPDVPQDPRTKTTRLAISGADASVTLPAFWTPVSETSTLAEARYVPEGTSRTAATMRVKRLSSQVTVTQVHGDIKKNPELSSPQKIEDNEAFHWIDRTNQCAELAFNYNAGDTKSVRYFYILSTPRGIIHVAEFDGPADLFNANVQQQVRNIMRSWTFAKQ